MKKDHASENAGEICMKRLAALKYQWRGGNLEIGVAG